MATILNEPGKYAKRRAVKKRHSILTLALSVMPMIGIVIGFQLGQSYGTIRVSPWLSLLVSTVVVVFMWGFGWWSMCKLDVLEDQRMGMRNGAASDRSVSSILGEFPDDFCVIKDLVTPFGSLDHVVVGPTGVFLLDTMNWRGSVTADRRGELLLNNQPTDKPYVHQFVCRVMGIKDKIKTLSAGAVPYFQPLFIFTCARVDITWGATGTLACIRNDQLFECIVANKRGRILAKEEIDEVVRAFLGLADMDTDSITTEESNVAAFLASGVQLHRETEYCAVPPSVSRLCRERN